MKTEDKIRIEFNSILGAFTSALFGSDFWTFVKCESWTMAQKGWFW